MKLHTDEEIIKVANALAEQHEGETYSQSSDTPLLMFARAIERAALERAAMVCRKAMDCGDLYPEEAIRAMAKGER